MVEVDVDVIEVVIFCKVGILGGSVILIVLCVVLVS